MAENEDNTFKVVDRRGQEREAEKQKAPEPAGKAAPQAPQPTAEPRQKERNLAHAEGPITFGQFVLSLASSAIIHLGLMADPATGKKEKNLPAAKQDIDLIEMLAQKTKGNLAPDEAQLLEDALYDLRIRFVEATKGK